MTSALGIYSLMAAVLAAAGALVASAAGWLRAARALVAVILALFTLSAAALVVAILGDQFHFASIANYSERALPIGYKLASFWAGQAGSLLLWAWMVAAFGLVAVITLRKADVVQQAGACGTLAIILGFFAALMLFVSDANPFAPLLVEDPATHELIATTPADGHGLNPMLQDPAMLAHPPLLFLGYAGLAITFALMVGGVLAGQLGSEWLARVRRWTLASWVLLGAGILLGMWWAYVELGWGGYWAWDPVENASLLPWLTATALLHTLIVQRSRGQFKGINAALIALTFLLTIFGTWLTRSGVIQSVHSFAKSEVGVFLLVFLVLTAGASAVLLLSRWKILRPERGPAPWTAHEWTFFTAAGLLMLMMLFTALGTIRPLLSEATGEARMSVAPEFYNRYVAELFGLLLVALMTLGPLLTYGRKLASWVVPALILGGAAALIVIAVASVLGLRSVFAVLAAMVAVGAVLIIGVDFVRTVSVRRRRLGERLWLAAVRAVTADRRRYGAQVAHVGAVMIMAGIVGSSLFGTEQVVRFAEGQSVEVGRYRLTFQGLRDLRGSNFGATEAAVEVAWPDGARTVLRPQQRRYDKSPDMVSHEIALTTGLREDLYLALAGGDEKGEFVFIKVLAKPLLLWIWIGGIVLTLGNLVPRLLPAWRAAPVSVVAEAKPAKAIRPGGRVPRGMALKTERR